MEVNNRDQRLFKETVMESTSLAVDEVSIKLGVHCSGDIVDL